MKKKLYIDWLRAYKGGNSLPIINYVEELEEQNEELNSQLVKKMYAIRHARDANEELKKQNETLIYEIKKQIMLNKLSSNPAICASETTQHLEKILKGVNNGSKRFDRF